MGRPLKIQKYGTAQGITYNSDGTANTPAAGVPIDRAFPPFSALTAAVYPTGGTNPPWEGVVGGAKSSAMSATYPIIKCEVNITDAYSCSSGSVAGVILRQKGSHKYLVATTASIDPENAVAGVALRITAVGDTDWTAMGLKGSAAVGTIFTPSAAAGSGTTGTAQEVGVCILTSDLSPAAGLMAISYTIGDSTEVAISKLTNKFINDWTNFQNSDGTSLDSYASGGDNAGSVVYTGEGRVAGNFFTDEGTVEKSGAEAATCTGGVSTLTLGIVENYTS